MSTLAGAASTFVAILAGFYTTKIFSISTDKTRLQSKINELELEIEHKKEYAKNLKIQIDKWQEEKDDDKIKYFEENLGTALMLYDKPVNSYDDIIEMWKKYWNSESEPSESILKKLKARTASLIERLKPKEVKQQKFDFLNNPERIEVLAHIPDDTSRMIESNYALEEKKKFDQLKTDLNSELIKINYLEKQLDQVTGELRSITYPKHVIFGISSFVLFAILGVIIPLTSQWWQSYSYKYLGLDPNSLAVILFIIGLFITFLYFGIEIYSIFHKKEKSRKITRNELKKGNVRR
jgi:outer membrane murein-binding lipoprotein Lpp